MNASLKIDTCVFLLVLCVSYVELNFVFVSVVHESNIVKAEIGDINDTMSRSVIKDQFTFSFETVEMHGKTPLTTLI